MSTSEQERQALISLEMEKESAAADLAERERQLRALLQSVEDEQKAQAERSRQIKEARERLARAEAQEASAEQAGEVSKELATMLAMYHRRAAGKVWYAGDDEVDPIIPFQMEGAMFGAAAQRWILGDEMGLGKTRQSIGWLDLVQAKKVLIVCEAGVCTQFAGEVMELAPHREVRVLYKKSPAARHELMNEVMSMDECVVIVNFEIWRKDKALLERMAEYQFDTIIVDEAHNLKTTSTSNFKYIEALVKADNVCPNCKGHIVGLYEADKKPRLVPKPCRSCGWKKGDPEKVRKRWPLDIYLSTKSVKNLCLTTGTPILNSPLDLYSLLHLCDPLLFKSKAKFNKDFCIRNPHSGKTSFRDGQLENLKPLIAGRLIARKREEVGLVLPVQRQHLVRVDVDPEKYPLQYRTIRQVTESAQIVLDSGESMTILDIMALITRKRQANVWPGGIQIKDAEGTVIFSVGDEVQESAKLDEAQERITALHAEGRRQVVFSQFTTGINEFARRLKEAGLRVAVLTGETPEGQRKAIKSNFYRAKNEEPLWDVVLCNYKTGGTGLNLTAVTATHEIDEEWNPGKRDQARGRTSRIGQTEENDVYTYRVPASIDTWMANIIKRKEDLIKGFEGVMTEADEVSRDSLRTAMREGTIL